MKRIYTEKYLSQDPQIILQRVKRALKPKNLKRYCSLLLIIPVILIIVSVVVTVGEARISPAVAKSTRTIKIPRGQVPQPPEVYALSAILVDADSGSILYEKNAHMKLPMASTTKMMTALVVRDQLDLNEKVTITPEATQVGEQEIWLEPGETLTVEQLLWALLVQSANDAAIALAEHTTGAVQSFVTLMNRKASEIGAKESHFVNPHGLDENGHYSTAYDLAIIGRKVLQDPVLAKMVSSKTHELPWPGHPSPRVCTSCNELLGNYPGVNGIKTGYTRGAGFCLVASVSREGKRLIAVVLNSEHRSRDASVLFDYGLNDTKKVVLAREGENLGLTRVSAFPRRYVKVVPARELSSLSILGSGDTYSIRVETLRESKGWVRKGEKLGKIICTLNGTKILSEDLIASRTCGPPDRLVGFFVFLWYSVCTMARILSAPIRAL